MLINIRRIITWLTTVSFFDFILSPSSVPTKELDSTSTVFRASRSVPLFDDQLELWRWEIINEGYAKCGFGEVLRKDTNLTMKQQILQLGLHCQAVTWLEKAHFYNNRHYFSESAPHYEKIFIYYNILIKYTVKIVGLMPDSQEKLWLEKNPWFLHIQLNGNAASLTTIPIFKDFSWVNFNHTVLDDSITSGYYSNNIGWLYDSSAPNKDDFVTVEIAINLHPTEFDCRFNETVRCESSSEDLLEPHRMKIMHNIMKRVVIVIDKISISFVSQQSKLPLNYTIANIDKVESTYRNSTESRKQVSVALDGDPCRLHNTLDGQVLANITILSTTLPSSVPPPRIFCGIFTIAGNHHKAKSIRNTWAKKCSFFIAFSTQDDLSIPAINLAHIGEEKYNNMWQKTRAIWKYVHEYYIDDFDWFLLGGDDMYYIMENLVAFLTSEEIILQQELQKVHQQDFGIESYNYDNSTNLHSVPQSQPGSGLYIGRRLLLPKSEDKGRQIYFNSGGPGYLLDRKALRLFITNSDEPFCFPNVLRYAEDAFLAGCLIRTKESLFPFENTHDSQGRPRFHIYSPSQTYRLDTSDSKYWLNRFDPYLKNGSNCCSPTTISFHNISTNLMHAMDDYLYRCDRKYADLYQSPKQMIGSPNENQIL